MCYFRAKEREATHDAAYRLYMTTCAQALVKSVCQASIVDFSELISDTPVDRRSGDEIAAEVFKKAGLSFGGGEES